jgi:hypothetical protein
MQLEDKIKELYEINDQIWRLEQRRKDIQTSIKPELQHRNKTSKSFDIGDYSVRVPSWYYWKLDKRVYEQFKTSMPDKIKNIIKVTEKTELKYEIDEEAVENASQEDKRVLSQFLTLQERDCSINIVKVRG